MIIEICTPPNATTKEKGDLLEKLSKTMLEKQFYNVAEEVRRTGSELDLYCQHNANKHRVYVECKAYRDKKIDAPIIRQLLGTVGYDDDIDEGWLITTSELGKDALGMNVEIQKNPKKFKISIYTPEKIISSLIASTTICNPPESLLATYFIDEKFGDWYLLITPYGYFWAKLIIKSGTPQSVICFDGVSGNLIKDDELITKISLTDTSLGKLEFRKVSSFKNDLLGKNDDNVDLSIEVVEVQRGDEWKDYRPARPQDFVGRKKEIDEIFELFKKIREKNSDTRIFSITGNSGLGKSSLIVKLLDKSINKHNKQKLFLSAVDMRAAKSSEYIYFALLKTLQNAQSKGFGNSDIKLEITNYSHPIDSPSIIQYLESLGNSKQLVVLVFDQFEELFSKQELFDIFNHAKTLLTDTAGLKTNFCIGFAWKTDATTHSDHPAYFLWQSLSDYRVNFKLSPFSEAESKSLINRFESQIEQQLHSDLKHNLIVGSQGYPWLLKKLCIHLYDKILSGYQQKDLLENQLDISTLFSNDLEELTTPEIKALKYIAIRAPIDMVETIDACGDGIISQLIGKRLIIKSGVMLNIYWDIFKEYLITGNVPILALRYLPSTDFSSLWKVAQHLSNIPISIDDIASKIDFSHGTIQNVSTDLLSFGIASRENGSLTLSQDLQGESWSQETLLGHYREKFQKHIVSLTLKELPQSKFNLSILIQVMKNIYSSNYADKTWSIYANRIINWLDLTGFIKASDEPETFIYKDIGSVKNASEIAKFKRKRKSLFYPKSSPNMLMNFIKSNEGLRIDNINKSASNQKNIEILRRYNLIDAGKIPNFSNFESLIIDRISNEKILIIGNEIVSSNAGSITNKELGNRIRASENFSWNDVTAEYVGKKVGIWVKWLKKQHESSLDSKGN